MRILMVTSVYRPATAYGGPVESMHQLAAALVEEGVEVSVLSTDADGAARVSVPDGPLDGVQVRRFRAWPLNSHGVAAGLWRAVFAEAPAHDLLHCQGLFLPSTTAGLWAARRHGKPVVVSPRGSLMAWGMSRRGWRKRAYLSLLDAAPLRRGWLHLASEAEHADAVSLGFERAFVVQNGVDLTRWAVPAPLDVRARWGLHPTRPLVVSVGRFHPVKNLDLLLDATEGLGVTLVLAGDAENAYGRGIRARLERERRTDVSLIGYVEGEAKAALLQQAQVFASASHVESYGLAIVEALAAGCSVLCGEGAPWQEIVPAGAGLRVPSTTEAYRAGLAQLLQDPAGRAAAAQRLAARHAWSERGREMLARYTAILRSGGASC